MNVTLLQNGETKKFHSGSKEWPETGTDSEVPHKGPKVLEREDGFKPLPPEPDLEIVDSAYFLAFRYSCLVYFLFGACNTVFWPYMAVRITEDLGFRRSKLGFIFAAYSLPALVVSFFLHYLLNWLGGWKVISLGCATIAVAAVLYCSTTFSTLVLAACVHGLGYCLLGSGIQALLAQFPAKIQTALAATNIAQVTGGIIGPVIAYMVSREVTLTLPVPAVCLALAATACAVIIITELRRFHVSVAEGVWVQNAEHVPKSVVLKRPPVVFGCLGVMWSYMINGFLMVGGYIHVKQTLQISTGILALIFTTPEIVYSIVSAVVAIYSTKYTPSIYAATGVTIMGISLNMFGPAPFFALLIENPVVAKVLVLIGLHTFEIGSGMFYGPLVAMMQNAVLDLGAGGNNTVVSLYFFMQGVGELAGRAGGGLFLESAPETWLLTCGTESADVTVPRCMSTFPVAAMFVGVFSMTIGIIIVTVRTCSGRFGWTWRTAQVVGDFEVEDIFVNQKRVTLKSSDQEDIWI